MQFNNKGYINSFVVEDACDRHLEIGFWGKNPEITVIVSSAQDTSNISFADRINTQ